MCFWWHQAVRSTRCPLLESWWLFPLFRLSCKAEEAPLASQCTSELKYRKAKAFEFKPAFWKRYMCVHCFSSWPPGMIWPTSWTVRAEFLSSVFTLITPWLSPPIDNMALAGSGAPRTPGLQEQEKSDQTGQDITISKSQGYFRLFFLPVIRQRRHTQMCMQIQYLRMATVSASGEVAHGQITSGFRPWDWKTFRKASHDDTDPDEKQNSQNYH